MRKTIFAAGYFGYGNFGDELILALFTRRMKAWRVRHIPRMKTKPLSLITSIANADAVVFPGGSIFQDETSSLSLLFYSTVICAAALLSKPVFLIDSGFEIRRSFNKAVLKQVLKLASFISVRDGASYALLRSLGLRPFKSADCAFSLQNFRCRKLVPPKTIGVIPRGKGRGLRDAIASCRRKWPGSEFKFAVLSPKDMPEARHLAGGKDPALIETLSQAECFFAGCDFFILMPYHSLVLAELAGADYEAVFYSAKTMNFLQETGPVRNKRAELPRIAEECAFQIFVNLLKDKLKP